MTDRRRSSGRVVVAVDGETSEFALELARYLSESMSPELLGLFVENAHLLDSPRARLAREITRSGRERRLERTQLERQFRDQSARARARFEQAAARLGLRHSFRVTRGEVGLLEQAAEAEALVLGLAERAAPPDPWMRSTAERLIESDLPVLLFAREGWTRGRSVAVVVDDVDTLHASTRAALRLAAESGSPLTVLLTGPALADRAASAERIVTTLTARGADVREVVAISDVTADALARAMRLCQARLLVVPGGESRDEAALVVELLRRLPSALMLVRE